VPSSLCCPHSSEIFESTITQEACTFGGASAFYTSLKGNLNVIPSQLAMAVAVADKQQLVVEITFLERDKHTQLVEWHAGK